MHASIAAMTSLHRVKFGELWSSNPGDYEDRFCFFFATTGQKLDKNWHITPTISERTSRVDVCQQTTTESSVDARRSCGWALHVYSQLVDQIGIIDVPVLLTQVRVVESVRDLGVVIDSQLSLSAQVTALCRSAYYYLRQLHPAVRSLSTDAARTLVQAFISCHLDYCNSLMSGMANSLVRKVQSVQNAVARLVSGASRREHITPVLRELHWLPVHQQIHVKLSCLMHKSLSEQAPQYLVDDMQLVADSGRHLLRSASDRTCVVPRTHNSFGDRSFSAAGPRVWNALPQKLRQDTGFGQFRRKLKLHLFV